MNWHCELDGIHRKFHLNDGASYEWSRSSKYLERIINPGGDDEEKHERVAKARLMRQFKFDYELLVDENKIDREVALATGFISMITHWGLGHKTYTRGPTMIPKELRAVPLLHSQGIPRRPLLEAGEEEYPVEVENRVYLVVERPDGTCK